MDANGTVTRIREPSTHDRDYFHKKMRLWPRFWSYLGYDRRPDLNGRQVLDIGCGYGSFVVAAALDGAQAVGIDINQESLHVGEYMLRNQYSDATSRVQFLNIQLAELNDSKFDYILSNETFEHILDLPSIMDHLYRLLKPGGLLLAVWGPIWPSAFGGHWLGYWPLFRGFGIQIPFSHLLLTRISLFRYSREIRRTSKTIQDAGLNGLTLKDNISIVDATPFEVSHWKTNVGQHLAYRIFRILSMVPGLRNLFTHNIYAILRKPDHHSKYTSGISIRSHFRPSNWGTAQ